MHHSNVRKAKINEEFAQKIHDYHDNFSTKFMVEIRKNQEKEERETCYFFISEIERCNAQVSRLQKTGNLGDAARCLKYKEIIAQKTKAMEAKFSKEEIEVAKAEYNKDPKWSYLLNEKQR